MSHILQTITEAMLEGLLRMEGGDKILPSSVASTAVPSEDELGATQYISQKKGASKATHSCRCCSHWGNTVP